MGSFLGIVLCFLAFIAHLFELSRCNHDFFVLFAALTPDCCDVCHYYFPKFGAPGGTRTPTPWKRIAPKAIAATVTPPGQILLCIYVNSFSGQSNEVTLP